MSENETNPKTEHLPAGITASDAAMASSANKRINIPMNLENWRTLPEAQQAALTWFHQHILDHELSYDQVKEAIGYDASTVFRVLKGTYGGSLANVVKEILAYKRVATERETIQAGEFVENSISRLIFGGLDYAYANNSITQIIGESRQGKSISVGEWTKRNNHGRSVLVSCPGYGGNKMLLRRIAEAVGVNQRLGTADMFDAVCRAFNRNRILIVDEAHRLIPTDNRSTPHGIEMLRDLHDTTHCGLALVGTKRFDDALRRSGSVYMFEQYLGRIGMPIRLPKVIRRADILAIVEQYIPRPSERLMAEAEKIANALGRLGILVEVLKATSQVARKRKTPIGEEHFFTVLSMRKQMMGED